MLLLGGLVAGPLVLSADNGPSYITQIGLHADGQAAVTAATSSNIWARQRWSALTQGGRRKLGAPL